MLGGGGRGRGWLVILTDFLVQIGLRLSPITQLAPVVLRDFTLGRSQLGQSWVAVEKSESLEGKLREIY